MKQQGQESHRTLTPFTLIASSTANIPHHNGTIVVVQQHTSLSFKLHRLYEDSLSCCKFYGFWQMYNNIEGIESVTPIRPKDGCKLKAIEKKER